MKKIGIMGGTFNPIHTGHLILAQEALEQCSLDEIMFIPSGISYLKKDVAILDSEIRLKLVELAIENNPKFKTSRIEIDREGNTYTCDTLIQLRKEFPEDQFYFITGDDSLFALDSWYHPEKIFENCTIISAIRNASNMDEIKNKAKELEEKYNANIILLNSSVIEISSSNIRNRIKNHQSAQYLLPEKVWNFIMENHLY